MKQIAQTESQTAIIATTIAKILKRHDIICLHGTLGMGKTVFARALIRALINDQNAHIPSPTFTLLQTYDSPQCPIYHFDLYRIKDPDEIFELGWDEALADAITIIEWPERLGAYLPQSRLDITLSNVENKANARNILIERTS